MQGRPLPSARIPYFLSATTVGGGGWRLSWGLSSRGSVLAIRWGQDPPEEGRGQGKTQRGRYQLICSCDPGMGQGPGGHEEQGLSPHVPETALVGARRPV